MEQYMEILDMQKSPVKWTNFRILDFFITVVTILIYI